MKAKAETQRVREEAVVKNPYSTAVARVAKLTGVPASRWEWKLDHPYVKAATRAAKILAGLEAAA
jgi:hypothetical protein